MPVICITDGNSEVKFLDCFRAAQRLRSPMAGRLALRGYSNPFENLGISRGYIIQDAQLHAPIILVSQPFYELYYTCRKFHI